MAAREVRPGYRLVLDGVEYKGGDKVTVEDKDTEKRLLKEFYFLTDRELRERDQPAEEPAQDPEPPEAPRVARRVTGKAE